MNQQPHQADARKRQEAARIERQLAELIAKQAQYLLLELARLDRLRRGKK